MHSCRAPPKDQAQYERWSLVYFTRPNDAATLRHLGEQSDVIAAAVMRAPPGKYEPGVTAEEWLVRRVRSQRVSQYKVCLRSDFNADSSTHRDTGFMTLRCKASTPILCNSTTSYRIA